MHLNYFQPCSLDGCYESDLLMDPSGPRGVIRSGSSVYLSIYDDRVDFGLTAWPLSSCTGREAGAGEGVNIVPASR